MAYILKKVTGGGGGGDATAANQSTQIGQLGDINDTTMDIRVAILKSTVSTNQTLVITFIDQTPAFLATQVQTFLVGNSVTILSICFTDSGIVGITRFSCFITYQY